MSVRVISDVFKFSESKGTARLVLIALADVANDEGEVSAYARSETILMRKANCGRTSVRTAIAWLVEHGEITRTEIGDGRRSSCYEIHLEEGADIRPPEASDVTPPGGESDPLGAKIRPPISPSLSVVSPSSSVPPILNALFDDFWQVYPRKVGKPDARKAWARAAKRHAPNLIICAAERYVRHLLVTGADHKFVPHPTTWLNRDGWEDDLTGENQPRLPRGADATARTLEWMRNGQ